MAIIHQCCCWNNVRSGSLAAGIYTIILSLVCGALMTYNIVHLHEFKKRGELLMQQHEGEGEVLHTDAPNLSEAEGWYFSVLVTYIFELIAAVILIIGIHKDDKNMLIPWICTSVAMVIMDTAVLIFQCVKLGLLTLNIVYMVIWLGVTFLNVYCILCVISQYQELRSGRGTSEYIRNQRIAILYRPGIQQVHITQGPIVMAYPGTVTTATSVQQNSQPLVSAAVTTTVMMAPPDYNVAASRLPRYSVVTATEEGRGASGTSTQEPLLATERDKNEKDTPPPYMP